MDEHATILKMLNEYTRCVDERDWQGVLARLAPEVRVDFSSLSGGGAATVSSAELVHGWQGVLGNLTSTQHVVTNHLLELDRGGESGVCRANFIATHVLADETSGQGSLWTLGGRYEFELVRTDGAWQISGLTLTALWQTGNPALLHEAARRGGRD